MCIYGDGAFDKFLPLLVALGLDVRVEGAGVAVARELSLDACLALCGGGIGKLFCSRRARFTKVHCIPCRYDELKILIALVVCGYAPGMCEAVVIVFGGDVAGEAIGRAFGCVDGNDFVGVLAHETCGAIVEGLVFTDRAGFAGALGVWKCRRQFGACWAGGGIIDALCSGGVLCGGTGNARVVGSFAC